MGWHCSTLTTHRNCTGMEEKLLWIPKHFSLTVDSPFHLYPFNLDLQEKSLLLQSGIWMSHLRSHATLILQWVWDRSEGHSTRQWEAQVPEQRLNENPRTREQKVKTWQNTLHTNHPRKFTKSVSTEKPLTLLKERERKGGGTSVVGESSQLTPALPWMQRKKISGAIWGMGGAGTWIWRLILVSLITLGFIFPS